MSPPLEALPTTKPLAEKAAFIVEARAMQRTGMPKRLIAAHLGVNVASLSSWLRDDTLEKLYPPRPLHFSLSSSNVRPPCRCVS
jgi:hypothetical protein